MPRPCPAALCRLAAAAPPDPAPDPQLLRAFLASRSEAAFAELVRRHGPMVLAVCRRVLGHAQDAEDAFQAAFLVLARRAGTIRGANVAGWLYGVAVRTARGVRIMRDRRQRREAVLANDRREPTGGWSDQPADIGRSPEDVELAAIIDEELAGLPEYYRLPVVLCELQGRSRKEAAAELSIPEGTLSSRLAAAKKKLADRLTRRGVSATAAAVAAVLADHAAARVPGHLARAAAEALPGSVASHVADGVVKALFAAQLKGVVVAVGLAVGLVGGVVLVSDGTGGTATAAVTADPKPADKTDPAAALVKQLGDPDFATREAAEKALRELGVKAKPALRAGTRDPSPEVSRRAAAALAVVRREQLSAVFVRLVGDDPPARDLFARIMSAPRGVDALEAALDDPRKVNDLYRTRTAELLRVAAGHPPVDAAGKPSVPAEPDVRTAPPVPLADVAGWLFLGALQPGTTTWSAVTHPGWENRLSSHLPFLPEDDYTSAKPIAAAYSGSASAPLKKLTAVWLAKRRENDGLRAGLTLAIRYDIAGAVATARGVLKESKPTDRFPPKLTATWLHGGYPNPATTPTVIAAPNLAAAIILVGLHGTKADLPMLARHTADDRTHITIVNAPPSMFALPTKEGRDLFCQVRDAAAVAMCKLAGKNPADFGFPPFPATKHPNGRPMSLHSATAVGFKSKADRTAAFAKAASWLKSFEPPPPDPKAAEKAVPPEIKENLREHVKRIAGDDRDFVFLYPDKDDVKNVELLLKAAAGDPDLRKLYLARRDELNAKAEQKDPTQPGVSHSAPVPLDDITTWLLVGTFPGTKGDDPNGPSLHFLDTELGQKQLADALAPKNPLAKPLRKLVAAWLANRGDEYSALHAGLKLAVRYDIPEALPTGRRVIKEYTDTKPVGGARAYFTAVLRSYGMLVVGKYGTRADLPLLAPHFDDPARVMAVIRDKPGERRPGYVVPIDGKDVTCLVGDVALAMAVRLRGGDPRDFGFVWPTALDRAKIADPLGLGVIGFRSNEARAAAHKKAKAWLAEQAKPDNPKK